MLANWYIYSEGLAKEKDICALHQNQNICRSNNKKKKFLSDFRLIENVQSVLFARQLSRRRPKTRRLEAEKINYTHTHAKGKKYEV